MQNVTSALGKLQSSERSDYLEPKDDTSENLIHERLATRDKILKEIDDHFNPRFVVNDDTGTPIDCITVGLQVFDDPNINLPMVHEKFSKEFKRSDMFSRVTELLCSIVGAPMDWHTYHYVASSCNAILDQFIRSRYGSLGDAKEFYKKFIRRTF